MGEMGQIRARPGNPRGIALIAVLWIVAALSIAATGIAHTVKSETRTIASARRMVEMQGIGEAVIMLALQEMTAPQSGARLPWRSMEVAYGGHVVMVEAYALSGYVDINKATPELLTTLFSAGGGLNRQAAEMLAHAVIQTRQQPDASGQPQAFEAIEDLMRVPGIDYDLYARLRPLITTDAQGSGKVNPQAAPQEVLTMLLEGDAAKAAAMANTRQPGGLGIDATTLRGDFIDNAVGSRYRLQASIPMVDGSLGTVACNVDLNPDQRAGLPWRIFGTETWMHALPAKHV
jgi:general secretion pathway protein K